MITALYPGTFDPVTYGHIDIATRASCLFDRLIVGIYDRPQKNITFTAEERVEMMRESLRHIPHVQVVSYSGLTVNFARAHGAKVLVRGLRAISDFELEYQMALTNQKLAPDIDTICLMTTLEHAFLSSSIVKDVFRSGGCVQQLVPPHVITALRAKIVPLTDPTEPARGQQDESKS
ncbi:MAG: pantetheine-phosphate adenylyltransferase [Chloroflexi bacterium]|nr:pantetheine-phosphate adenylyltransferase [Chloroflexota bacterium]